MAVFRIFGICVLFLQIFKVHCQATTAAPPVVSGSYRAIGEMTAQVLIFEDEPKRPVQVAFEENYDMENQMSVFSIWEDGRNETFVENYRTNTTIQYFDTSTCKKVTKEEWMEFEAPPSLMGFSSDGNIRFPLQKLLTIDGKFLKEGPTNKIYRGVPAVMWMYEMKGKEDGVSATTTIYVYWSTNEWDTATHVGITVPLGYKITKIIQSDTVETETQNINVFAFMRDSLNKAAFEAREGVYCEGDITSEYSMPSLPRMDAVTVHSEIVASEYLEVKNVDIFYDMKNKLLRIDMDRIGKQEPGYLSSARRITSEFTSKELGATFETDIYKGKLTCEVMKLDNYEFEAQDIINPKLDAKDWDMHHFFGVNSTKYRYIGKTTKRNIPCHVFQGNRTDWPQESAGTISMWEWCLAGNLAAKDEAIVFRDKELPIVSLKIYFIKNSDPDFPPGSRLVHHFYDVIEEDPNVMYATAFDISRCFTSEQRSDLQFAIDSEINEDNVHIFENATSNPAFLQQWREQIYNGAKLTMGSLRVTKVRSAIYNKIMFVTFTLLDVHPDLPDKSKYISLADAKGNLTSAVDSGSMKIRYVYQTGKSLDLKAKEKTLVTQIDPNTIVQEKSTPQPPEPSPNSSKEAIPGYLPGTVGSVSAAMVIVGITLGAGGTFIKYKGLPQCCKRN